MEAGNVGGFEFFFFNEDGERFSCVWMENSAGAIKSCFFLPVTCSASLSEGKAKLGDNIEQRFPLLKRMRCPLPFFSESRAWAREIHLEIKKIYIKEHGLPWPVFSSSFFLKKFQ